MRKFQKKGKFARITESKPFLVLLGIFILFFFFSLFGFMDKMKETSQNKNIVENKVTELQENKQKLSEDIEKLNTNEGVEENIREKFGLAKDGENMIMVVPDKEENDQQNQQNNTGGLLNTLKSWFK